jgi:hypothetical protein
MAAKRQPLLVDVLVNLSLDWHIAKARCERAAAKRRLQEKEIMRRIKRLDRLTAMQNSKKRKDEWNRCKARHVSRLNDADSGATLDEDFHLHPFPDIVARIARWTGLKAETIRKAATADFSGFPNVVTKLRELDGRPETQQLCQRLTNEHFELAKKIGLTGQSRQRKRGRPVDTDVDADRRLAEAWDSKKFRTHAELAKEKGISRKEVLDALERHRSRRRRGKQAE